MLFCKGFELSSALDCAESKLSKLRGVGVSCAVAQLAGRGVGSYSFYLKSKDKGMLLLIAQQLLGSMPTATAAQRPRMILNAFTTAIT